MVDDLHSRRTKTSSIKKKSATYNKNPNQNKNIIKIYNNDQCYF